MNVTDRVRRLRERVMETPAICVERAKYYTQSCQATEALPTVIRRAMAVSNVLDHISIRIDPDELIAGCHTSKVRGGAFLAEINGAWLLDELDTVQDRTWEKYQPLTGAEKETIRQVMDYWKGRSLTDMWRAHVPPQYLELENIVQSGGYTTNCHYPAHFCIDYPRALELGLSGCIQDLKQRMAKLRPSDPEDVERLRFYEAAVLMQEAVIRFAHRYADLARDLAGRETDPVRRGELERIEANCRRSPAQPARTFYEAVQAVWLMSICAMQECWGAGVSLGRCDQYLLPYYRRDIEAGILTPDQARELLELLYIKMNDVIVLQAGFLQVGFSGYPVMQGLTIGGVDRDGRDAVNELSYLLLDAEEAVGLTAEEVVVRIADCNPLPYVDRACEVARNLNGKLKFVSDHSTIAALRRYGLPLELARDYISCGCHCPMVPAVNQISSGVIFNYPLMLELALNNGVHRLTGKRIGVPVGDPRQFRSALEVEAAFQRQFQTLMDVSFAFKNADVKMYAEHMPCPLISSFYTSCRERGEDLFAGGAAPYAGHVTSLCGIPNVADSLAAIQKVVFEDREATMDELLDALERDFEGYGGLWKKLCAAPRFGNDLDEVDLIARRLIHDSSEFICAHRTYGGKPVASGCIGMTVNIPYGEIIGALPDGRKKGEPLSEGGISPYQGRNLNGITATMNSVAKIDHTELENGSILNLRISAGSCSAPDKVRKLAVLIRTFCQAGGSLVQFNFTSNETLRDAQKRPEKYRDLLVRVATYSSFFVELSTTLQNNIIERNGLEV